MLMPIYLWHAKYNAEGVKGVLKEGGSKRREAVRTLVEGAGGKLHSFYYAFGDSDVCGIVEFPDTASALAMTLAVNSSGAVHLSSTPLITPEEVDAAVKKTVGYRAPGK